jgi:hypothetical protein
MRVDGHGVVRADALVALFEDLEQQAQGLALRERDGAVEDLAAAQYAEVDLISRLHASAGTTLGFQLPGSIRLCGRIDRVGADFCVLADDFGGWLVRVAAVSRIEGLSGRAVVAPARPLLARLTLSSMLRRLAVERAACVVQLSDTRLEGRVVRVGRDFFELAGQGRTEVVPVSATSALRVNR